MKKLVIEALAARDLSHIYSEKQYLSYYRKALRNGNGGHRYLTAMMVADLFIFNATPAEKLAIVPAAA